jgi:CheY-like chemotaxis protein
VKPFKVSICSHPTTVKLVDDNETQLKHLSLHLAGQWKIACHIYSDPKKALNFLTNEYKADPFINRCLVNRETIEFERLAIDFNIKAIEQEIYNPKRFNEMAVLVVDYAMPGINGVELCRALRKQSPHLKIIMLTGEAGKDLAVQTFNEGVIDKFIMKSTPDLLEVLAKNILELQQNYFLNLSEIALNKLAGSSEAKLACLEDNAFAELFKRICDAHRIVEYYLVDNQGSFLLLDAQAKPSWLAMANEELMLTYANLAEEDNAPASIVSGLKNRQMMPYFYSDEDFAVRPAEWQRYLHPANKLPGKEAFYYTYISNSNTYALTDDKVFSYQEFLAGNISNRF